ncbi:c-type cytochrome [Candidatus Palauibacter sp.]|uniref:c-type cytochrome n=1 Tax=Candidatus Palauibacter sp. TaxID=3101350 RepID=UPI003B0120E5
MTARTAAAVLITALVAGACDDQIKHIEQRTPLFNTMSWQRSVEAFEEQARLPVPGTMPIDGERTWDLLAADTMLASPIAGTEADPARGEELFGQFCTPCHGVTGAGDGPVVGQNRIPFIPLLDIRTEITRAYSDGYLWGMITNGRGLMPSYPRIPDMDRWYLVAHVRRLQAEAMAEEAAAAEAAAAEAEATAGEETEETPPPEPGDTGNAEGAR